MVDKSIVYDCDYVATDDSNNEKLKHYIFINPQISHKDRELTQHINDALNNKDIVDGISFEFELDQILNHMITSNSNSEIVHDAKPLFMRYRDSLIKQVEEIDSLLFSEDAPK